MKISELRSLVRRVLVSEMKLGVANSNPHGSYFEPGSMEWQDDEENPNSLPYSPSSRKHLAKPSSFDDGLDSETKRKYNDYQVNDGNWEPDEEDFDNDMTQLFAQGDVEPDPFPNPPSRSGPRTKPGLGDDDVEVDFEDDIDTVKPGASLGGRSRR